MSHGSTTSRGGASGAVWSSRTRRRTCWPGSTSLIGRAVIGAVVAEFITAINGLGYYIIFNVRSFHQDQGVVALVVIVIFALVVRALVNLTVARVMPWYRPAKEA